VQPQHFGTVPHFHPNGEADFHDQCLRDCAKNLESGKRGWGLLRVSYREFKDLEDIVDEYIEDFVKGGREPLIRATNAQLYNSIPR
jgi:hypothetical protein